MCQEKEGTIEPGVLSLILRTMSSGKNTMEITNFWDLLECKNWF